MEQESFSRNDLICLFTDGVTETTNPDGEEFGLNRLKDELTHYAKLDPQSLNQKIIQDLNKFSDDNPDRDDLTLLTLRSI